MMSLLGKLASLRLTLVAMFALLILVLIGSRSTTVDVSVTVIPLAVLSINLLAAILTNHTFRRQTGLLVFHVGLLLLIAIIGLSVLIRFDGHVEVLQGASFDPRDVEVTAVGWLHPGHLDEVRFEQGDVQVEYLAGLTRQSTRSTIQHGLAGVMRTQTIGDRQAAEINGYRFITTPNKGFALLMRWEPAGAEPVYGAIHFPSYPQYDWKQVTDWVAPSGQHLQMELDFAKPVSRPDRSWVLERPQSAFSVNTRTSDGITHVVAKGGAVALEGGMLRVVDVKMWIAYRIDYYPLLPWAFVAALLAIAGMALHFRERYQAQRSADRAWREEAADACIVRT
jgi:cytochrome c biogenesis protein